MNGVAMWAGTWARFGAPLRSLSPPVSRDQTLVRVHAARLPPSFCSRNSTMSARIALVKHTQKAPGQSKAAVSLVRESSLA